MVVAAALAVVVLDVPYGVVVCGATFALAAGLVRAGSLPAGAAGAALGLATMTLVAQTLGPLTVDIFGLDLRASRISGYGVLPIIVAMAARPTLLAYARAGRGTR